MKTVLINTEGEIPPPTGNPFPVFAYKTFEFAKNLILVDTGLEISCGDLGFEVRAVPGLLIMSWSTNYVLPKGLWQHELPQGRLTVLCWGKIEPMQKIADVFMMENSLASVRFMEKGPQGGRIVRGDVRRVDSPENRIAES